jgi:hypothetical protein
MFEALGITCRTAASLEGSSQSQLGSRQLSTLPEALSKQKQSQNTHAYALGRATVQVSGFLVPFSAIFKNYFKLRKYV